MKILDTHQHLWDLTQFRLPWLPPDGPLARSHTPADYARAAEGLGIEGTIYMEVGAAEEQREAEIEYVVGLCSEQNATMLGAVVAADPSEPGFIDWLRSIPTKPEASSFKGVRIGLHGGMAPGYCLQPDFVSGVRLLANLDMCFDICIRSDELGDAAQLAARCSHTRFVLDHCGNPNVQAADLTQWKRGINSVAQQPNVVCKISGLINTARPGAWSAEDLAPIVEHCAAAFGYDRLMFASDWPVCTLNGTLRSWVEALDAITRDWQQSDREKLFALNAEKFYAVQLPTK